MPLDRSSHENHESSQPPTLRSDDPQTPRSRAVAILTACAILALPIGYLVKYYGYPEQASASSFSVPVVANTPPPQSLASLEQAVRDNPSVDNRIDLSLAYIRANQPQRALPVLNSVIAENGKNSVAWNNLCVVNIMQMSYNLAIEDCNKAIQFAPDFQLARNNLKWAEDEKTKAIAALASQENTAPASRNADSYLQEGLSFLHVGNNDEAIKAWQRTLQLDPRNALAANNIGTAYMFKNQPATAIPWFEKALVFDPSLQIAKDNLAWARDEFAKPGK